MNYIYDILLDFNDALYDFFDWNEDDKVIHVRKIPLIKVCTKDYNNLKINKVKLDNFVLEKIMSRTEVFNNHRVDNIKYACLISNGIEVFACLFNDEGISYKYSSLLIDENDEVIEVCEKLDDSIIKYDVLKKNIRNEYLTRKDINIIKYIDLEIDKLKKDKDNEKIRYLYYELFDEKCDNIDYIINKIKENTKNIKSKFYLKIYNFFKLTSLRK